MTIKQYGGIFGRNPTFNNATIDGTLTVDQIVERTGAAGITLDGVTLKDGNVVLADGKGIDFSATAGTGTSELFDDYEEGTWTPAFNTTNGDLVVGSGTIVAGLAKYTKIGNRVFLEARFFVGVSFSSVGTGDVIITGLPFASSSANGANSSATIGFAYRFATAAPVSGYTTGSEIRLLTNAYTTASSFTAMPAANLDISGSNKNIIALSVNYEAV